MAGTIIADDLQHSNNDTVGTEYLIHGSAKVWTRFNPSSNTEIDSLNQSSRTDNGTGKSTINFTNNMNNDDFEKYYESKEANEDSKSDANVILFLVIVTVIAMTYWVAGQ